MSSGLPDISVTIEVSDLLQDVSGSDRVHSAAGKQAMRDVLEDHHRVRIPEHFKRPAHAKYHYQSRQRPYVIRKMRMYGTRAGTDLIRTGHLEAVVTSAHSITVSGRLTGYNTAGSIDKRAMGPGLLGTLRMPWPIPESRDQQDPRRVTIEEMKAEIKAVTPEEEQTMAVLFGQRYIRYLRSNPTYARHVIYRSWLPSYGRTVRGPHTT